MKFQATRLDKIKFKENYKSFYDEYSGKCEIYLRPLPRDFKFPNFI